MRTSIIVFIIVAVLVLSLVYIIPASFATQSETFVLNINPPHENSGCGSGLWVSMLLNADPSTLSPTVEGSGSPAISSFCSDSAYSDPSMTPTSVTVTISASTYEKVTVANISGNMIDYSSPTAHSIFTFDAGVLTFTPSVSCSLGTACCQSQNIVLSGPFGTLAQGDYMLVNINFTLPSGALSTDMATLCSGSGQNSQVAFTGSPLVTPEFPYGTILSVLASLAAIGIYLAASMKMRPRIRRI